TTLGYERLFNWGLASPSESEFMNGVLAGQPEPPKYFAAMKRVNREGPPLLGGWPRPVRLDPARLPALVAEGAPAVDLRPWREYAAAHVPGTLSIPLNRSFTTWAGSLLSYHRDYYLIVPGVQLAEAVRDLAMIGLDRVRGWVAAEDLGEAGALAALEAPIDAVEAYTRAERGEVALLDVRGQAEWAAGHVPDDVSAPVRHVPLGDLPDRLEELPRDRPLLVYCKSGSRSAIAVSLLAAHGFAGARNVEDGFDAWQSAGCPVQRETGLAAAT
ncbi:MAG TPA: rhodanese-like domain-containing protein, partial [Longimicrobiales bacterium]|nr:rhodanese-like domain-containing protein [Longimicrobiales bacterium]